MMTVYELIQKLSKFESNDKVTIKNGNLCIINSNKEVDNDIEQYEEWINSIENKDSIY